MNEGITCQQGIGVGREDEQQSGVEESRVE
jgi:hypothetical protein